jgi:hypothetical protein
MFDCGVHPAYNGVSSLPYFDEIEDVAKIDLLLVSQCALASLPLPPCPFLYYYFLLPLFICIIFIFALVFVLSPNCPFFIYIYIYALALSPLPPLNTILSHYYLKILIYLFNLSICFHFCPFPCPPFTYAFEILNFFLFDLALQFPLTLS